MDRGPTRPWLRFFLCALAATAALPMLFRAARLLPRDTRALTARKYGGWSGVLRLWVDVEWAGSGPKSWLNRRIDEFERRHPGVYIQADPVSTEAMAGFSDDPHPPDMVLVSPGILPGPEGLTEWALPDGLRGDLLDRATRDGRLWLAPVYLGGYALATGEEAAPSSDSWDAALLSLRAAGVGAETSERTIADAAALAASELDYVACASFDDQLACLGIARNEEARLEICRAFAGHLLSEESQLDLSRAGCFSPFSALRLYDELSPLHGMEAALAETELCAPHLFDTGWREVCNDIVRKYVRQEAEPGPLWRQLRDRLLQKTNFPPPEANIIRFMRLI